MPEIEEIDFDSPEFQQAVATARQEPTKQYEEKSFTPPVNTDTTTTENNEPNIPVVVTPPPAPVVIEPNYTEYLATKSGNLIKSEEDFIAALEKVKNYDSLEIKLKDTETKIPQFKNETQQKLFEAWVNGQEDEVKAYWAEKDKPYATMSDIDVMKSALKSENPNWDSKRIDLELRHKYGTNLEKIDTSSLDPDLDKDDLRRANDHNREVEKNLELLEMHAFDKRQLLLEKQKQISLPELKKTEIPTQETKETPEQAQARIAKWQKRVDETVPNLSNFKIDIDNKGVEYVWTDEEKASLVAEMKDFNIFKWMESEGWTNKDGSWNPDKIAEGVRFLRDRNKVIASVAGQIKTETIRQTMAKIKGIDPKDYHDSDTKPQAFNSIEEAAAAKFKEMRAKQSNREWEEPD